MTIAEILSTGQNISITISVQDLAKFAEKVVSETCQRMELSIANGKTESLLSVDETASKLSVSKPTLWRWHNKGYLTHVEVGGERRYRVSDITRIIQAKRK